MYVAVVAAADKTKLVVRTSARALMFVCVAVVAAVVAAVTVMALCCHVVVLAFGKTKSAAHARGAHQNEGAVCMCVCVCCCCRYDVASPNLLRSASGSSPRVSVLFFSFNGCG